LKRGQDTRKPFEEQSYNMFKVQVWDKVADALPLKLTRLVIKGFISLFCEENKKPCLFGRQ
jgi:hypothetical protein